MRPISLRKLIDDGLLFEINRQVLHPLGLALALKWEGEDAKGEPDKVLLLRSDDNEGILFAEQNFIEGAARFSAFMQREGGKAITLRRDTIGFIRQTRSDQLYTVRNCFCRVRL